MFALTFKASVGEQAWAAEFASDFAAQRQSPPANSWTVASVRLAQHLRRLPFGERLLKQSRFRYGTFTLRLQVRLVLQFLVSHKFPV